MPFNRWLLGGLEAWLTTRLLMSPMFHNLVRRVHGRVQRLRHGTPMEEMGGTKQDTGSGKFLQHFKDELKEQFKGKKPSKHE
ncbi:hypothetical protein BDV18DRAFT_131211 [Aspergillus unguis]